MQIALTSFALRQWDPERAGTRIVGLSPDELVRLCNAAVGGGAVLADGYAPFCKHLFLENPSPTRAAFAPVTEANRHLLRSGYKARREGELAVLERWFEGLEAPRAGYLDVILTASTIAGRGGRGAGAGKRARLRLRHRLGDRARWRRPSRRQCRRSRRCATPLGQLEGGSGAAIDRGPMHGRLISGSGMPR
ncbi:MAG: DUF3228 family protein [Hyphomicrobiales bacterium]